MNNYLIASAALLSTVLAGQQAHAQAAVEEPGYCAQYYPSANCTNYGPGNPLYPSSSYSYTPSGPAGNLPGRYYGSYAQMPPGVVHHRYYRHRGYR
jgi:hypothetical protein